MRDHAVFTFKDCSETISLMQRAGELVEIKTFTGKKTLMNAVALVLHGYFVWE
jgi:hypothetical protein